MTSHFLTIPAGCNIKNVHALNLILEEMGILIHSGNSWLTSKEGVKYTACKIQAFNADAWHPSIVNAVYEYLKTKERVFKAK